MRCWLDLIELGDEPSADEKSLVFSTQFSGWVHHSVAHGWHTLEGMLLKKTEKGFDVRLGSVPRVASVGPRLTSGVPVLPSVAFDIDGTEG